MYSSGVARQTHCKRASLPLFAVYGQRAAMTLNNPMTYGKPQANSAAVSSKERREYLLQIFLSNSASCISEANLHVFISAILGITGDIDCKQTSVRHRLYCIENKV